MRTRGRGQGEEDMRDEDKRTRTGDEEKGRRTRGGKEHGEKEKKEVGWGKRKVNEDRGLNSKGQDR